MFGFGLTVMGWGRVMCSAKQSMKICQERDGPSVSTRPQILTLAQPSGKPSRNWTSSDKRASHTWTRTFNSGGKAQSACCKPHGLDTSFSYSALFLSELRKTSDVTNPNKKGGNTENEDFQRAKKASGKL